MTPRAIKEPVPVAMPRELAVALLNRGFLILGPKMEIQLSPDAIEILREMDWPL